MRTLSRYTLVSAAALVLDYGLYLSLIEVGLDAPVAAPISYVTGAALHYLLSRFFVFTAQIGWLHQQPAKEVALYIATIGLGAAITTAVVYAVHNVMLQSEEIAKIAAIGISFVVVYLARKLVVFKPAAASLQDDSKSA